MNNNQSTIRPWNQLRPVVFERGFTDPSPGSVLVRMGRTAVLCTASVEPGVPPWREHSGFGWLTAEYSMLPGSTHPRKSRPRSGHTDSRGTEIQRLIGRSLRAMIDFQRLGENTIFVDCDVLQADGGTRTAAINGAVVAVEDAVAHAIATELLAETPVLNTIAAVSVGLVDGQPWLDLDYQLDSRADVDMNVVMNSQGDYIELQGTGEQTSFTAKQLQTLLSLADQGITAILDCQRQALKEPTG